MTILIGSEASDTLVGTDDADTLSGLAGNDVLEGKLGTDTLEGGDGDDRLIGGGGDDILDGGSGFDYAVYSDATGGVRVDLSIKSAQATGGAGSDTLKSIEGIVGSNYADNLIGDSGDNRLAGGYSNDTLMGGGGADVLDGGAGADLIDGGDGFDFVDYSASEYRNVTIDLSRTGSQGAQGDYDTLLNIEGVIGSSQGDVLKAASGASTLLGGGGGDALYGGTGDDLLDGGDGDDQFYVGVGADRVIGGAGSDTLHLIAGSAGLKADLALLWSGGQGVVNGASITGIERLGRITASAQADTIVVGAAYTDRVELDGQAGDDTLSGGAGGDLIYGGLGQDSIDGGAGDDFLYVDLDDRLVGGGSGNDIVVFERNTFGETAINVDLRNLWTGGSGFVGGLEIREVERLGAFKTSNANDTVTVGVGSATAGVSVELGAGDDRAYGGVGNDSFSGGDGDDTLYGGAGSDGLFGGLGVDRLYGEEGADQLVMGDRDTVDGGAGFDTITFAVDRAGDAMNLDLRAVWAGGTGTFNGGTVTNVENINDLYGTNAADVLMVGDGVKPLIDYYAYAGRETFFGQIIRGYRGDDTIIGSGGADKIYGDQGADKLSGGAGDDTIVMDGDDTIDGGAGIDTLSFGAWWFRPIEALNIDLRPNWEGLADAKIRSIERIGDAYGSDLADRIIIGDRYTTGIILDAGEGDDYVVGSGGNDGLRGGYGNDTLIGGLGNDVLTGAEGDDFMDGGAGEDAVQLDGDSTEYSWSIGADGVVTIRDLRTSGYDGVDTLKNVEILRFADKYLTLSGATGLTVIGSAAADVLVGTDKNDTLRGEGGNDTLDGGAGDDILDGGSGFDLASYANATSGIQVNLLNTGSQNTGAGLDQLISIEGVIGSAYADRLTGGSGADRLGGGGGDDWFSGEGGDDTIDGGDGADTVEYAGASASFSWSQGADGAWTVRDLRTTALTGVDTLRNVEQLKFSDKIVLLVASPQNIILGTNASDNLRSTVGDDVVRGAGGDDFLYGGSGNDIYDGGDGRDLVLFYESIQGVRVDLAITGPQATGEGNDTFQAIEALSGSSYADIFYGDYGANSLSGQNGDDQLDGRAGNDSISGDAGNDIVHGGAGDDNLAGGSGNDFVFGDAGDDYIWLSSENAAYNMGSDVVDGGDGYDTAHVAFTTTGLNINLGISGAQQIAPGLTLTINNVERLFGGDYADKLTGDSGDNVIGGYNGDDIIDGGAGIDTLWVRGYSNNFVVTWTTNGWRIADNRTYAAPGSTGNSYDGVDTVRNMEYIQYYDKTVALGDGMSLVVGNILRANGSHALAVVNDLSSRLSSGSIGATQAVVELVAKAGASTSVATLAYQFFTGKIPSQAGVDYLVSPTGPNANNLNSAYYQSFNLENRYINFAVNLGKLGEGKDAFAAKYGALSMVDATREAYKTIFGAAPTDAKIHAMIDGRVDYFAAYGGDGANGVGTKAAMVGWLLAEAQKADLGVMVRSNNAWLTDLADGSAPFAISLIDPSSGYYKADFIFGGP
ncbi:hypothetical protein [Caulobacter vibrioides]|uniref:hypothetical protein n=1 Tax=Caulobacter vibrioides TaxID=155892 RepID=UPI0023507D5A|nr:hypothetical protein [Caulobacter vibrioides]